MNRVQLLRTVSERTGMAKKEVEQVYDSMVGLVADSVKKGEKVALTGFGNFTQRVKKARKAGMARNPFTGEMVKQAARPAMKLPKFVPAKTFKDYVSGAAKAMPGAKPAAKKSAAKKPAAKKSGAKKAAKKRR
ncbi:MAG: HU family DNA-binding protein [Actinomycetota bacterium]|nr:HU family DNA-binding protein [Actinomycetota bacterium]